jgi:hypothetical protein
MNITFIHEVTRDETLEDIAAAFNGSVTPQSIIDENKRGFCGVFDSDTCNIMTHKYLHITSRISE